MASLTLWGRRSAFNVQKVLWALGELGLGFELREVGGSFGGLDTPEFRAPNPHGRIPVRVDGGLAIRESHSILRYLAARYGDGPLWPEDPAGRTALDACERHFQVLEAHLAAHSFLAGARFTMGDIPAGATLQRYFEMGLEVPRPPRVLEWRARLAARSRG
jgi:glutathione S-transferase